MQLLQHYDGIIQNQQQKGIIETVEISKTLGRIQYLSCQVVITLNKTTSELRIVYDASAKSNEEFLSFEEALHRRPVILPPSAGIQLRARYYCNIVIANVKKSYLKISLRKQDRDVARFLWVKNWENDVTHDNIQISRFTRDTFGMIA